MKLTKAQQKKLLEIWQRPDSTRKAKTFLQFRRSIHRPVIGDYIGVGFCGMYIGIEQDGYAHS